jgi:hypothetical protein
MTPDKTLPPEAQLVLRSDQLRDQARGVTKAMDRLCKQLSRPPLAMGQLGMPARVRRVKAIADWANLVRILAGEVYVGLRRHDDDGQQQQWWRLLETVAQVDDRAWSAMDIAMDLARGLEQGATANDDATQGHDAPPVTEDAASMEEVSGE